MLYQYSISSNNTMKNVFLDVVETTKQCGNSSYNCLKQKINDFSNEKTQGFNLTTEIELPTMDKSWTYIAALVRLYSRLQEEDWIIDDVGRFFIKMLNSVNWKIGYKWRWETSSCASLREDFTRKVHHTDILEHFNIKK
jgi:hypothetical protein